VIRALYNEIDAYACAWLSNLMDAGQITPGKVDDRPIQELTPDDVRDYERVHFFAGIAGWDIALNLAGWPDDGSVCWTGSCPCQPFSAAGAGKAADDERHLWPAWASLIAECRPGTVFGEQVEAAIGWGWLDLVFADLEAEGYACGSAVLPACGVGAPHIRNRLWFVADDHRRGRAIEPPARLHDRGQPGHDADRRGEDGGLGDAERYGARRDARTGSQAEGKTQLRPECNGARSPSADGDNGVALAEHGGREGRDAERRRAGSTLPSSGASFWSSVLWLPCADGKARPVEPGVEPLAHGVQRRPSKLRAYGNAIVPQVAAEFISAFQECAP
jgi:DNA (cytosine-5)-methyltransferase 1